MKEERKSFEEVYQYYGLPYLFRKFSGNDKSFLAVMAVFEILHNFHEFYKWTGHDSEEGWDPGLWMKKRFEVLKKGRIEVRPEVINYVIKPEEYTEEKRAGLEKEAAKEALEILESGHNIKKYIEDEIKDKKKRNSKITKFINKVKEKILFKKKGVKE